MQSGVANVWSWFSHTLPTNVLFETHTSMFLLIPDGNEAVQLLGADAQW